MSYSQNLRTRVALVKETAWGVIPATPAMTELPVTAFTINATRSDVKDSSIRADRMQRYAISGNTTVGGDITVDLASNIADELFASVMKGTWVADTLKVGTVSDSFTIEQGHMDTGMYSVFTGMIVDKVKLNIGADKVTATFSFIGKDLAVATSPITGATYAADVSGDPFTQFKGTFKEGGSVCGYLSAADIDIASGSQANFALGSTFAQNVTYGLAEVNVGATAYFVDNTFLTKFLNGTHTSFEFTVTNDAGKSRTFKVANVKLSAATKTTATSGSVTVALTGLALFDVTAGSPLVVTRTV